MGFYYREESEGYTDEDLENYKDIMIESAALYQNNDPHSGYPWASWGEKWKKDFKVLFGMIKPMGVVYSWTD